MFERLTDRARRVLVLAQEEARDLHHGYVGTEHLLLGLVHEGEGVAARVLLNHGSHSDFLARVYLLSTPGPPAPLEETARPYTPRAKKVLEFALREALQLGHNYVGTEHLLLALIREGEGVGAKVLADFDLTLSGLRSEVIEVLSGFSLPLGLKVSRDERSEPVRKEVILTQPFSDTELEAIGRLCSLSPDQVRSIAWLTTLKLSYVLDNPKETT